MIGNIKVVIDKKEYTIVQAWDYKSIKEWFNYIIYDASKGTDENTKCVIYAKRKDDSYKKMFLYKNIKKETDKCLSVLRVWNSKRGR